MTDRILDLVSTTADDLPPRYGSDRALTAVAQVVDLVEGGRQLRVSLYGGAPVQVSAAAATWTGVRTCHVLVDPDTGRPLHALSPAPAPEGPIPTPPKPEKPGPVRRRRVVPVEWSGTHRAGTWMGVGSAVHQGSGSRGLVSYGRQLEALGPIRVRAASAVLEAGAWRPPWQAVLQAASYTPAGPAPVGATLTATVSAPTVIVDVTRIIADVIKTGGIALVGAQRGAAEASGAGLALTIDYDELPPTGVTP
ncbi:hypothetical protein QU668_03835 [Schaalia sp. HMT-877]|nr:hypothetical protein HMPREF1550_00188 [Actinomyces sp. oral taxon 877 str. F0543]WLD80877.1 hypothetical protein QU668_03835 [Schaalia sp. HMT-877]